MTSPNPHHRQLQRPQDLHPSYNPSSRVGQQPSPPESSRRSPASATTPRLSPRMSTSIPIPGNQPPPLHHPHGSYRYSPTGRSPPGAAHQSHRTHPYQRRMSGSYPSEALPRITLPPPGSSAPLRMEPASYGSLGGSSGREIPPLSSLGLGSPNEGFSEYREQRPSMHRSPSGGNQYTHHPQPQRQLPSIHSISVGSSSPASSRPQSTLPTTSGTTSTAPTKQPRSLESPGEEALRPSYYDAVPGPSRRRYSPHEAQQPLRTAMPAGPSYYDPRDMRDPRVPPPRQDDSPPLRAINRSYSPDKYHSYAPGVGMGRARSHSASSAPARGVGVGPPHGYRGMGMGMGMAMGPAGMMGMDMGDEAMLTPQTPGTGPPGQSRRLAHLMSEQKRRESINAGFQNLRQALPTAIAADSKAIILRKAVAHIHYLEDTLRRQGIRVDPIPGARGKGIREPSSGLRPGEEMDMDMDWREHQGAGLAGPSQDGDSPLDEAGMVKEEPEGWEADVDVEPEGEDAGEVDAESEPRRRGGT